MLSAPYKTRQLNQRIRDHLAAARDTEELLLWARAAQVAGLPAGFHVRVDTTVLIGAAEALPRSDRSRRAECRTGGCDDPVSRRPCSRTSRSELR